MKKHLYYYPNHTAFESSTDQKNTHNVVYCDNEAHLHYDYHDYSKDYFTIESLENNNTIYLKASNSEVTKAVSVSTDNGTTWVDYTSSIDGNGTTLATLNNGEKLLVKGENGTYGTHTSKYNQFKSTGQFEVNGNIMSLLSGDSFANADRLTATYTFDHLFYQCTGLISAENLVLPAITLAQNCYSSMFRDCTSLTTAPKLPAITLTKWGYAGMFYGCINLDMAPELPATTLAQQCYDAMFAGCTLLTTAPELPATTLADYCYEHMFRKCTSLKTTPQLPATILKDGCYIQMFSECSNLTTAPALPATTLAIQCYNLMFKDCTSLTTAPELPTTTLAVRCYDSMFRGCTSLTTTPELPATTLADKCYYEMFSGCTSLNSITCLATDISATNCTTNWVDGVASNGTFTKATSMSSWTTGASGIPSGWTVQTASN